MVKEETDQENWKNHTISLIEELDDEKIKNVVSMSYIEEMKMEVWINAKGNMAMELAIKEDEKKAELTNEELVPDDLHKCFEVFDKNKANQFPESNVWDHKIFKPKSFKNYNLTPEEQKELDKFLNENLEKDVFDHLSPLWPLPSSLSKRKIESYNLAKITGICIKLYSCQSFGVEHQMLEMRNKGTWLQLMCCADDACSEMFV